LNVPYLVLRLCRYSGHETVSPRLDRLPASIVHPELVVPRQKGPQETIITPYARKQQQIEVNSQLRAAATSLARACQGRDFAAMGTHATQLLALYQISRGNPESLEDQEPAVTDRA
jgi:hypothetical protein